MESSRGNVSVTDSDCQEQRPGPLFSDRGWALKLGLTVGIFAILSHQADRRISEIHPDLRLGASSVELVRGKTIHGWARKVLAVTPDGFDVETSVGPFHVTYPDPGPRVGDYVSFVGEIVALRHVVASGIQINTGYLWKRGLNYGLSSVTVLAFLWIVRRRFRWKLSEGLFRSRY
jgi:hypothetical protein